MNRDNKKKRWDFRRILGVILIALGLVILAYELVPPLLADRNNEENFEIVQEISAEEIRSNQEQRKAVASSDASSDPAEDELAMPEIDYDDVQHLTSNDYLKSLRGSIDKSLIEGILYIPAVDLKEPIYNTLTNETLYAGSAVMRYDQEMGEGNYPIAGHNTYDYMERGLYFENLNDIEEGDIIRITDKETIYEYKYVDFKMVHETQVDMVEDFQADAYDGPIISLMRCEIVGLGATENREFFIGVLVNEVPYSDDYFYSADPNAADDAA